MNKVGLGWGLIIGFGLSNELEVQIIMSCWVKLSYISPFSHFLRFFESQEKPLLFVSLTTLQAHKGLSGPCWHACGQ